MEYYDSIAEGYDELHGEEQRKKLRMIMDLIHPVPGESLLDVGCGTGICTVWPCSCTGIDPSKGLISIAKKNCPDSVFVQASAESIPFRDHSFDYVISVSALHLCHDVDKALDEIRRVGKDVFVFSILKKSAASEFIIKRIKMKFRIRHSLDEGKDIILST